MLLHESIVSKALNTIKNNKGKLTALAGTAALAGAGVYAHDKGYLGNVEAAGSKLANNIGANQLSDKLRSDAENQYKTGAIDRHNINDATSYAKMKTEDAIKNI